MNRRIFFLTSILVLFCIVGWCEEKICYSLNVTFASDDKLMLINPDGTGETEVFKWTNMPVDADGQIHHLRPAADKSSVIARSNYAFEFTPNEYNVFALKVDGSQTYKQYTPGPNSGIWNSPGPYGTVKGIVKETDNITPISGARVYVEGVENWVFTDALGAYTIGSVPGGSRWITTEDGEGNWGGLVFSVTPGTEQNIDLVPNLSSRGTISSPVRYQDRIYYILSGIKAGYVDLAGDKATYHEIYVPVSGCYISLVWMDVRQSDGKIVISDWGLGCNESRGLYTMNKDGGGLTLAVDFKSAGYSAVDRVFWHPTQPDWVLVAYTFTPQSGGLSVAFGVLDLNDVSQFKGAIAFPANTYTHGNVELCGWSPTGDAILYTYWATDPHQGVLAKFAVDANGVFTGQEIPLATNKQFSGATWIEMVAPVAVQGWYLR